MEPNGIKLINTYKKYYKIPSDVEITEQMVMYHWDLEKRLTQELLISTPENRWETFERCYTQLYSQCDWLNNNIERTDKRTTAEKFKGFVELIGPPPQKIYEIGSGRAELLIHLARSGHVCKGTDISRERGEKHLENPEPNITWGISDGIHLDRFESAGTYDVAISTGVVEHMHPDDHLDHLKGVYSILAPGGRYLVLVPHRFSGPHDVSWVFGEDRAVGMHLKEYTYKEMIEACKSAGFRSVYVFPPTKLRKIIALISGKNSWLKNNLEASYGKVLVLLERALFLIPNDPLPKPLKFLVEKSKLFPCPLFIAQK